MHWDPGSGLCTYSDRLGLCLEDINLIELETCFNAVFKRLLK